MVLQDCWQLIYYFGSTDLRGLNKIMVDPIRQTRTMTVFINCFIMTLKSILMDCVEPAEECYNNSSAGPMAQRGVMWCASYDRLEIFCDVKLCVQHIVSSLL